MYFFWYWWKHGYHKLLQINQTEKKTSDHKNVDIDAKSGSYVSCEGLILLPLKLKDTAG